MTITNTTTTSHSQGYSREYFLYPHNEQPFPFLVYQLTIIIFTWILHTSLKLLVYQISSINGLDFLLSVWNLLMVLSMFPLLTNVTLWSCSWESKYCFGFPRVMDILGIEHREQLKKGVEKRANLIKLAEHGSLRRDVRHALRQFYWT